MRGSTQLSDSPGSHDSVAFMPDVMRVMMDEMLPAGDVSRFSAVLTGEEFCTELNRLFLTEWGWGVPGEVRFRPFEAHDDRPTFEISSRTGNEWHSVIGKVHTVDRSDVFEAMQAVVWSGFGPQSEFAIPRPVAYLSKQHVLFEERFKENGQWTYS